jgi:hypothetical protein
MSTAAQQDRISGQVNGHPAFKENGSAQVPSGGKMNDASTGSGAGIDSRLYCPCIHGGAITPGAIIKNIE